MTPQIKLLESRLLVFKMYEQLEKVKRERRTDRGNNNIPKFSLKCAGIIIINIGNAYPIYCGKNTLTFKLIHVHVYFFLILDKVIIVLNDNHDCISIDFFF